MKITTEAVLETAGRKTKDNRQESNKIKRLSEEQKKISLQIESSTHEQQKIQLRQDRNKKLVECYKVEKKEESL